MQLDMQQNEYGNERDNNMAKRNLYPKFTTYEGVGKYGIPQLQKVVELPQLDNWTRFNYALSNKSQNREKIGIDFFVDDYQFERVWNNPERYLKFLKEFGCVLSPEFSIYVDFPLAVSLFNHYRKHYLAKYWSDNGITVIPTITWGNEDSFECA